MSEKGATLRVFFLETLRVHARYTQTALCQTSHVTAMRSPEATALTPAPTPRKARTTITTRNVTKQGAPTYKPPAASWAAGAVGPHALLQRGLAQHGGSTRSYTRRRRSRASG
jgi:hypothetical protein